MTDFLKFTSNGEAKVDVSADANLPIDVAASSGTLQVQLTNRKAFEFEAYPASAQTFATGTWTKVVIDTEAYDVDGVFDAATNSRYQPTDSGYFLVGGRLTWANLGSFKFPELAIYKNGSLYAKIGYINSLAGGHNTLAGCTLVHLNGSTDYVELYAVQNDTGNEDNVASQTDTAFWGFRVR